MKCEICNQDEAVTKKTIKRKAKCHNCIENSKKEYLKNWTKLKRRGQPLIYKIEYNNSIYVGSTKCVLKERLRLHFSQSFNDVANSPINRFIRDNFSKYIDYKNNIHIIELIEYVDEDDMLDRERFWVNQYKANLNINLININLIDKIKVKKDKIVGSSHWRSKTNEQDVIEIRRLFNSGMNKNKLSIKFSLSAVTINQIVNRKTWRHI